MVERSYVSHFAPHIVGLVQQKHAIGYTYEDSERILENFDRFCTTVFPDETALTKELGLAWAVRKETEGVSTFRNRMMPVRELARYMNRMGIDAYLIPLDLTPKSARYVPYIFTQKELAFHYNLWAENE